MILTNEYVQNFLRTNNLSGSINNYFIASINPSMTDYAFFDTFADLKSTNFIINQTDIQL